MKRKFLEDLGLEKEAVDKIMAENGVDIEAAKGDAKTLQATVDTLQKEKGTLETQLNDRDGQLETLKNSTGDITTLKDTITTLQNDNKTKDEVHAKELKQVKIDAAVAMELSNAKALNVKAVKALLSLDEVDFDKDGKLKGVEDQIKALKEADDSKFMFEAVTTKQGSIKGAKPGESGNEGADHAVDTKKMTYSELAAYMAANPDATID